MALPDRPPLALNVHGFPLPNSAPNHFRCIYELVQKNQPYFSNTLQILKGKEQASWFLTALSLIPGTVAINITAWHNSRVAVATLYHMFFNQNIWWNPEEVDYHFKDNESFLELKKGFQAISLFKVIFNLLGFYFLLSWVFVLGVHCHWGVLPLMLGRNEAPKMARKQSSASEKTWQFSELTVLICLLYFKARAGLFWKLARNPSGPKAYWETEN